MSAQFAISRGSAAKRTAGRRRPCRRRRRCRCRRRCWIHRQGCGEGPRRHTSATNEAPSDGGAHKETTLKAPGTCTTPKAPSHKTAPGCRDTASSTSPGLSAKLGSRIGTLWKCGIVPPITCWRLVHHQLTLYTFNHRRHLLLLAPLAAPAFWPLHALRRLPSRVNHPPPRSNSSDRAGQSPHRRRRRRHADSLLLPR